MEELKSKGHVVNCMGRSMTILGVQHIILIPANNAFSIGGSEGTYFSNPGEVVIWARCPREFPYYIMDDDKVGTRNQFSISLSNDQY